MLRILLVDDEREEREGIEYLIRKYQYPLAVAQAQNGARAMEYIEHNEVDILFTDVKMPVMDGLELAREVNRRFPAVKIIIFSAYGEFDYAKKALEANAVNYLLKPIEIEEFCQVMEKLLESIQREKEQTEALEQQNLQRMQNTFYRILTGARLTAAEHDRIRGHLFGQNRDCRLVHIECTDNFFDKWEELFLKLVKMYLGELTEYINLYPNEAYLLIREGKLLAKGYLKEQLIKLSRDAASYTKIDLTIIVGKCSASMEEFEKEIETIYEIGRDAFSFGNEIIWTEGELVQEHYSSDVEAMRGQLILAIEAGHVELIRKFARELADAIVKSGKVSKIYVQNVFYTVFQTMYDKNPDIRYERILNSSDELFYAKGARNIIDFFLQNIDEMLEGLQEKSPDDSANIQKIKRLVEKEYMHDINLSYVAEQIHLAPAYVSYIFKKETGQTLIKYITEVRMEKARMLLEEGNLKIIQIAKNCGYENQSYFNRAFKNYFGQSPKQYKER
ncbi:MAG: response regulator [Lachnospiraceae bacterium]|nr:response regulator [Lachnospiraceae bacterium]